MDGFSQKESKIDYAAETYLEKTPKAYKKKSIKEAMAESQSIRMFKSDFLERLSHVHPATPFVIYIPVVGICLYYAYQDPKITGKEIFASFFSGMLLWTLAEYLIHRFIFHIPQKNKFLKAVYFYTHGIHHDAPNDATRLVMPPGASIPLAILFFYLFQKSTGPYAVPLFAGFLAAYLIYDFIHFSTHFFNWPYTWFRYLKKNHMRHHYVSSDYNFGLSSPLWDFVFFTYYRKKNKT